VATHSVAMARAIFRCGGCMRQWEDHLPSLWSVWNLWPTCCERYAWLMHTLA
jgi:hypothetical protein